MDAYFDDYPDQEVTFTELLEHVQCTTSALSANLKKLVDSKTIVKLRRGTYMKPLAKRTARSRDSAVVAASLEGGPAHNGNGSTLPGTIQFRVVAELGGGKLLLRYRDDHFVARRVEL